MWYGWYACRIDGEMDESVELVETGGGEDGDVYINMCMTGACNTHMNMRMSSPRTHMQHDAHTLFFHHLRPTRCDRFLQLHTCISHPRVHACLELCHHGARM